jgi:ABC-2 type transport system permease protein
MKAWTAQTFMELRRIARNTRFLIFTLLTPLLYYLFFVLAFGERTSAQGISGKAFFFVSMATFGVLGTALVSFAGRIAAERERGWFRLLRTTPLPVAAIFGAKLAAALLASIGVVLVLGVAGVIVNGSSLLSAESWLGLFVVLVLGALPFAALAVVIGYFVGAEVAYSASLAVYFLLAMIGGLFLPLEFMPEAVQNVATLTPGYLYAKMGWDLIAGRAGDVWPHAAGLGAYFIGFAALAVIGLRREEGQTYR